MKGYRSLVKRAAITTVLSFMATVYPRAPCRVWKGRHGGSEPMNLVLGGFLCVTHSSQSVPAPCGLAWEPLCGILASLPALLTPEAPKRYYALHEDQETRCKLLEL